MTVSGDSGILVPVALTGGFGLLHRDSSRSCGPVGVVLCSAWGVHELSSRKVLFRLASQLASLGIPAIRFDYAGTADAIGNPVAGFGTWIDNASDAADRLKEACGIEKVVFAGIGIGATVATLAAAMRADVAGLALLAPVVSGRRYLREIALAAPIVEQGLGLDSSQRPAGVSVGGIVMPPQVASDLKAIELMTAEIGPATPTLIVARPSQPAETDLANRLEHSGRPVRQAEFSGFDQAMENPTVAVMPEQVIETCLSWCRAIGSAQAETPHPVRAPAAVRIERGDFFEEPVVFDHGLFGVVAQPASRSAAPAVIFVNSGYDHHAGWAYQWARAAHSLAASGIASLRFDMANIGDSGPKPGVAEQVLYSDGQQADISAAIDMLWDRGATSVALVGRCSGAFAAFHTAARDARVSATVLINPLRVIWDPDEEVEIAIRVGPRSMADYRRRAMSGQTLRRLLAGDIDIWGVAKGLGTQLGRRLIQRLAPYMGNLSKSTRLRRNCYARMEEMSRRGTKVRFVCSERDASLEQMAFYFGGDFSGLGRFDDATLTTVSNADHNMTPAPAHDAVLKVIRETVLEAAARPARQSHGQTGGAGSAQIIDTLSGGVRA